MPVTPYLFFDGRCEEALDFYKKTLGAKVEMMMRFKENPEPPKPGMCPPGSDDKVMHSCFRIGETAVMASDGRCQGKPKFEGFALSVNAKNEAEADKMFNALAEGGQVQMPMMKTFFSPRFGMVADRFGVGWMVIVAQ
ncbi:MAG: VOC family protein [Rhizobiales bacterium]|nr:VOC family protein [Hyphomicrobiales bacterium]